MCGIAGIWRQQGGVAREELVRMADAVAHRGPNDVGYWQSGGIGLAHRRLSILDMSSAGHQPMSSPDGRFFLTFNGEIFNYRELAQRYLSDVSFVSTSDTEVLLHLVARHGVTALSWLRGMYAFALWDSEQQELLLARDPFGKKPLYYRATPDGVWFASEAKSIMAVGGMSAITPEAPTKYFSFEYVPAPGTVWDGIEQVPMGTAIRWNAQGGVVTQFWRPHFLPKLSDSESQLCKQLDTLLQRSVERRLVSDVPVGLLLSGGLDSTTIGWYMRQAGARDFHSFSVSFSEDSFDESRYARLAAEHIGTQHHTISFTLETFQETLRELVPLMDIPLADASLLPTYAVSKLAQEFVTVVLDGDGSDELFGGYGTFQAAVVAERLKMMRPLFPLIRSAISWVPTRYTDFSLDFKLKSFVRGLGLATPYRNQVWLGSFTEEELSQLLQPSWFKKGVIHQETERWHKEWRDLSVVDQISLLTIYQYLHNDILVKLDRATMARSLEARTPFLDIDVADFAMRLPTRYKRDKYMLKKLMSSRLPRDIVYRPKKGFGIPLGVWLRGPLYEWGREVLKSEKLHDDGILQPKTVDRLWREHKKGQADHRKKLWTLLTFQLWYDQWVIRRPSQFDISIPSVRSQSK